MHSAVWYLIAALCAGCGVLLLVAPGAIPRLESALNRRCGAREVSALRLGLRGEQHAEAWLNRPVGERRLEWDGWLRSRPRLSGAGLLALAALLVALAGAG